MPLVSIRPRSKSALHAHRPSFWRGLVVAVSFALAAAIDLRALGATGSTGGGMLFTRALRAGLRRARRSCADSEGRATGETRVGRLRFGGGHRTMEIHLA